MILLQCCDLTSASNQATCFFLPGRNGEGITWWTWELVGWNKSSLIGKAKTTGTSKAKQGIYPPFPMGRQMYRKAGLHHALWFLWKTNAIALNVSPSILFPTDLWAEHDVLCYGILLWLAGVTCPGYVPSQLLVHSKPACWWGDVRARKDLNSV